MKRSHAVILLITLVLLFDQISKIYIKTHFHYNEDVPLFGLDWARLHFVENEGMAFGITFGWEYGKLILSIFRILMVVGLIWYLRLLLKVAVPAGFLGAIGLITAGAIGNILDSAFYGLIFSESPYHGGLATLVAPGEGYGSFLHGKVVDMLYFPITWIHLPDWLPLYGGEDFLFFSPIFNVADAAITTGVLTILVFQRRFFRESPTMEEVLTEPEIPTSDAREEEAAAIAGTEGESASEAIQEYPDAGPIPGKDA